MTVPDYVPPGGAPTQAVHNAPAPSAQWQGLSQDQLSSLRTQLVTSIIQVVVKAVTGIFVPGGGIGGATSQLTDWANGIPIIGDLLDTPYITDLLGVLGGNSTFTNMITAPAQQVIDLFLSVFTGGSVTGGPLSALESGITDLLGLIGNPTGLGTGSPALPGISGIPLLNGLFSGGTLLNSLIPGLPISQITNLATLLGGFGTSSSILTQLLGLMPGTAGGLSGLTGLGSVFTDLFGMLGSPTAVGSGTPVLPAVTSRPILGGLFSGGTLLNSLIPFLPFTQVSGINGATNIGVSVQDFIDVGVQALLGGTDTGWFLDDWKTALTQIPVNNVIGAGGMADVGQTFYTMWDQLTSAFRLSSFSGTILSEVSSAAQDTSFTAVNANTLAGSHQVTLGVRTNNPIDGALERTTVSNFNWTLLGTGTTPTSFAVTSAASAIGITRMPVADTKGKAYWYSSYTGTISGFYLNFGRLNLDGSVDHLFQTPDLSSTLTTTGSWLSYTLPDANKIVHNHSQNIVTEFIVVGSGTVNIAGQDYQWNTGSFPGATTKRSGATRNTAGGTPTLAMTTATMNSAFTTKTPWVGLGRVDVDPDYHPPEPWNTTVAGAFTYTIPTWARVAGVLIDYLAVGGGGGGQSGGYFAVLEGGRCGAWNTGTLVYGTDIPLGTTALTGTVGDNANGGVNPFILQPGDNGNATTITGIGGGFSTKTAAGGLGGGQSGNSWNQAGGEGAGNQIVGGYQAFGGAAAGVNQDGNTPGGGGGSGYPAVGRAGGEGRVWFRARQP